jgi:DMSO/TMAO reductase YedYZ molybdopterin-dependent catalytic subunit
MRIDRRTFVKLGGVGIVGVTFTRLLSGCEDLTVTPVGDATTPFITPNGSFFVQHGGRDTIAGWTMPQLTQDGWSMKISGEVQSELTIAFGDVQAAANAGQEITILKTMQCILQSTLRPTATGYAGNAWWTGVPLKSFLDRAGIDVNNTKRLLIYGYDNFLNNIPLERITKAEERGLMQPLLAYRMNGEPLPVEHGFPVRLIIPELLGYKNVKWIREVRASFSNSAIGTYQREGFSDEGVIQVSSRSTNLYDELTLDSGPIEIAGFAVSGTSAIDRVEVSIDGAPFSPASLVPLDEIRQRESLPDTIRQLAAREPYPFKAVWVLWKYRWNAFSGKHTIAIRATDAAGNTQPATDRDISDGQNGVAMYEVTVR